MTSDTFVGYLKHFIHYSITLIETTDSRFFRSITYPDHCLNYLLPSKRNYTTATTAQNESVNNQPTAMAAQNNADQPGYASTLLPTMTPVQETQNTPKKTVRVTPEEARPLSKARARKTSISASSRRHDNAQILTDTPVKQKIKEKAMFSANQRRKKEAVVFRQEVL